MMRIFLSALVAAASVLIGAPGHAQDLPTTPIRIVIPFAPGGSPDIVARLLAPHMSSSLGRNVIVENRPGAAGAIAARVVADSESNGGTLFMTTVSTQAIAPALFPKLPYDPVKDFTPISLIANVPLVLVAEPDLPAKDLRGLVDLLKSAPGKYSFASSGVGSPLHLAGELFKFMSGTDVVHVAYRGSAPAITDLMAGRVALFFGDSPSVLPQIEGKRIKAIAATTRERMAALPDLPTVAEAGLPGYEAYTWNALFAPAGLPAGLAEKLNAAVVQALAHPDVQDRLRTLGFQPVGSSAQALGAHVTSEIAKWGKVVRDAKVQPPQ